MNQPHVHISDTLPKPILPAWIFDHAAPESLEEAAFSSGSALALLYTVLANPSTPTPSDLLRIRLALRAAVQCCKIEGRGVTEAELRDAFLLTQPGDAMGPGGDMLAFWRAGVSVSLRHAGWHARLLALMPSDMQEIGAETLEMSVSGSGNPVTRATSTLSRVLGKFSRQEAVALLCADAVLSHGLGWSHPLPLFSFYLKRSDLRRAAAGEDIRMACHTATGRGVQDAIRLAHDLARRAHLLWTIAPKLRTKGSEDAIRLFLSEDAVLPSTMLSPKIRGSNTSMTGRSARRFCDRLVELGVVRELTGRSTFRLYGLA